MEVATRVHAEFKDLLDMVLKEEAGEWVVARLVDIVRRSIGDHLLALCLPVVHAAHWFPVNGQGQQVYALWINKQFVSVSSEDRERPLLELCPQLFRGHHLEVSPSRSFLWRFFCLLSVQ